MASLDKLVDWQIFSPRDLPETIELLSPSLEMVSTLQTYHTQLQQERQAVENVRSESLVAHAQYAVLVAQFAKNLDHYKSTFENAGLNKVYRALRIMKDQMLAALVDAGLEVIVPLGRPYAEVADEVEVVGWRHHEDFSEEIVAEVIEPVVRSQNKLIRAGRVFMGAPLTVAQE